MFFSNMAFSNELSNAAFSNMVQTDSPPSFVAPPAWESTETGKAFKAMLELFPFLPLPWHFLHGSVSECETALEDGEDARAADILERIEQELASPVRR